MNWNYVLTSHWSGDPAAIGRKCLQCWFQATHRAAAVHAVSKAKDEAWYCTSHAAQFAAEHALPFPVITIRTKATA